MTFRRNVKLFIMSYAYTLIVSVLALVVALRISKWLGFGVLVVLVFGFMYLMHRKGMKRGKHGKS